MRISSQQFPVNHVVTVELHENIYINCSAGGPPTPLIVVSHNGKLATNANSLEIILAKEKDEGTYCCNASNAAGRYNVTCLSLKVKKSSSMIALVGTVLVLAVLAIIVIAVLR